jgi:hypothetical protein
MSIEIKNISLDVIKKLVKENTNDYDLGEAVRKLYNEIVTIDAPIVDDAGCDVETGKFLG